MPRKRGPPPEPAPPEDQAILEYHRLYNGMTRGQLSQEDPRLYRLLWKKGLLDRIPTQFRKIPDLLAYYHERYEGLTRTELRKRDNAEDFIGSAQQTENVARATPGTSNKIR
jgi:hypothetical protein